jgi:uncharacterized protein (TIGR03435 family)
MRKALVSLLILTARLPSQTFDAASVKTALPLKPDSHGRTILPRPSGGPGTQDPGRIRYPYMTPRYFLMAAYDVKPFQITGPAWLDSERFDINATMPPETTREQLHMMLQNLLAERFKLTIHRETRELPLYLLVVAKGGPKLKESTEAPAGDVDPATIPPPGKVGPDGFPVLALPAGAPIVIFSFTNGRARMAGQQKSMQDLADRLTGIVSRPVIDATGLKAKYDFMLTYSPESTNTPTPPPPPGGANAPEAEPLPDIFSALQAQLGLRLESKKGAVEMIVIDHIEKTPTEN